MFVARAMWLGRAWRATEPRASANTGIRTLAVLPLELDPSNLSARSLLITSAGELGRTDKAITEANLLVERFGRLPLTVGRLAYAHGRAGERQAAERLIAELVEMATSGTSPPATWPSPMLRSAIATAPSKRWREPTTNGRS